MQTVRFLCVALSSFPKGNVRAIFFLNAGRFLVLILGEGRKNRQGGKEEMGARYCSSGHISLRS